MLLHFFDPDDNTQGDVTPLRPLPVSIQFGSGGSGSAVSTEEVEITGIPGGSNTLTGSSEKLDGITTATPAKWVWLYPDSSNSAASFWGDADDTSSPIPSVGIKFEIDDVNKVRINGTADDVVYWRYGTTGS